jgi:general secretion pathway protein H
MQNENLKKYEICNLQFTYGNSRRAGFTLIEIVIVLFIIGIASGLVGIAMTRSSGSLEIRKYTKEISSVLRHARTRAVSEKKIYCFVIDRDEHAFRLYSEDTDYKNIDLVMDKPIPEGLEMALQGSDEDSSHIEFLPRGSSTGGIIEIVKENGDGYFIIVNRITGKVDVEKME